MITVFRDARRLRWTQHAQRWVALTVLTACGGTITSSDRTAPEVTEVAVAPLTASMIVGSTLPLQATLRDGSGQAVTGPTVVWSVQDTNIAIVSPAGVLSARAVGSTQVAASANGISGLAAITVMPVPVASVAVTPPRVDLAPGAHASLAAVAYDAAGHALDGRAIIWSSSNSSVASVDANGEVTASAAGAAIITATSEGITGNAAINVTVPVVASLAIQPRSATIQRGSTLQLSIDITDASGAAISGRAPTWTSSNPSVAVVSASGLVTAVASGSARIAAALDGKADTVSIAIVAVPVGSVSVQPTSASLIVAQGTTLTATVKDANGAVVTDRQVAWTTSNAAVASVTQGGVVKALAAGTATISATSEGSTGSATITVSAAVASITLQPASATLQRNMTVTLAATLKDAGGNVLTGRVITWKSSDTTVASVSSAGVVTAVRIGPATITATSEGKSANASVTVTTGPVDHIVIFPTSVTNLRAGRTAQLTAMAVDANGDTITGAAFTWKSGNTGIATVSSTGVVTGVHSGTTSITATFSGKSGSASVQVR
jgi:uncharacterized protein YjdB